MAPSTPSPGIMLRDESELEDLEPPLFRKSCADCTFCDGFRDLDGGVLNEKDGIDGNEKLEGVEIGPKTMIELFRSLSFLDRYLAIFIVLAMISGVLIGVYQEDNVQSAFASTDWEGVSIPILIGLLVMMWPILTKVQYERLPTIFSSGGKGFWSQIVLSIFLNWIISPFVMLGLAWATLPEDGLADERQGVVLVGIARCIAMVLIWNQLARGNGDYCAMIVIVNSILQIILFPPYALLLINTLSHGSGTIKLDYQSTSKNVGIYLGIPLAAGLITRITTKRLFSESGFKRFINLFSPLSLIGLLYTIIVLFALQGNTIVHNIGSIFRIFVPLILYFIIVWTATFFGLYHAYRSKNLSVSKLLVTGGYETTVVQAFTAASNNFELAIAVAVASMGPQSRQALAATIGPLVEVPVLLSLSYLALWLRMKLDWRNRSEIALV